MTARMASTEDNDESLMALIQQGSHQAFAILVRRHTDRFYASAYHLTGNAAKAEDMVQEGFLKIWQKPSLWKADKGAKFTTWFYRILLNLSIDAARKDKRIVRDGGDALEYMPDKASLPDAQTIEREQQGIVEDAIASLPERQKTALNLCFYDGLSNSEAADVMGVKTKALESLLMRAKTGLKGYMEERMSHYKTQQKGKGDLYGTG